MGRTLPYAALILLAVGSPLAAQRATQDSTNNAQLKRALERFPEADLDKNGILTRAEADKFQRQRRQRATANNPAPTHADVKYGEHRLQAFDIWLPETKEPAPVVLYIHGGGFRGGDKNRINVAMLRSCLDAGYAYASINYRMIPEIQFPVPMHDSARALQLIRHRAKPWNLNPHLIASTGGSAGGGISLWLAFHKDRAKPDSANPIQRQSTRLTCVAVSGAQSSYDYRFTDKIGLPGFTRHPSIFGVYGVKSIEELQQPEKLKLMEQMSAITHLTSDDPPVLMDYGVRDVPVDKNTNIGTIVHHPKLGIVLREDMKKLGLECIVQYPGQPGNSGKVTQIDFIKRHFDAALAKSKKR